MESYTCLLYEEIGRVARLTLNRPEKLNALSVDLQTELLQAAK
jgi:enoyl-CoA hydratase/carnithine racemase